MSRIEQIRARDAKAMDVDGPGNDHETYWGPRDRAHLLRMVKTLCNLAAKAEVCPLPDTHCYNLVTDDGVCDWEACVERYADEQAGKRQTE